MLGRDSTEEYICDCLIELMREKPLDDIRVAELARHARISRTTFYRYFQSPYDVALQIGDRFFDGLVEVTGNDFTPDLDIGDDLAIESHVMPRVSYLKDNIDLIRLLNGPHGDPAFRMRLSNMLREIGRSAYGKGDGRKAYNERVVVSEFVMGGIVATLDWLSGHSGDIDDDELNRITLVVWRKALGCFAVAK